MAETPTDHEEPRSHDDGDRSDAATDAESPRQRVERSGGRPRRARLTPAPGSDPSPEQPAGDDEAEARPKPKRRDPDDDRITRERPPHW